MPDLLLKGGTVYDPANDVKGEARDLWIDNGRVIDTPPAGTKPRRTIDLGGYVVMPGGVEMHCHIAGPKVNIGRRFFPE
ncbi:amidohydrolase family protein, partial [bacterium]|nr:amidohydrolase family protein [bacterium]